MTAESQRINMRVSAENRDLIREASEANGQDMTSFVLGAALDRARQVVLESRVTRLTPSEASRLESLLEAEPAEIPALTALLRATASQSAESRERARA